MKLVLCFIVLALAATCVHAFSDEDVTRNLRTTQCVVPAGECDKFEYCGGGSQREGHSYGPAPVSWKRTIQDIFFIIKEITLTLMVGGFWAKGVSNFFKKKEY